MSDEFTTPEQPSSGEKKADPVHQQPSQSTPYVSARLIYDVSAPGTAIIKLWQGPILNTPVLDNKEHVFVPEFRVLPSGGNTRQSSNEILNEILQELAAGVFFSQTELEHERQVIRTILYQHLDALYGDRLVHVENAGERLQQEIASIVEEFLKQISTSYFVTADVLTVILTEIHTKRQREAPRP